jgi:hypothetical protein
MQLCLCQASDTSQLPQMIRADSNPAKFLAINFNPDN